MRRFILIALGAVASIAAIAAVLFYFFVARPLGQLFAPSEPQRVDLLAKGADALILQPFVTGDVPRLITAPALILAKDQMWYIDRTTGGDKVSAVLLAFMGAESETAIASSFQNGSPIASYTCVTSKCAAWTTGASPDWGLTELHGKGAALGPEVTLTRETYPRYAAYLAAYNLIAQDPARWFASPTDATLQPNTEDLHHLTLQLTSRFTPADATKTAFTEDRALTHELTEIAHILLRGTDGEIIQTRGNFSPLVLTKDDEFGLGENSSTLWVPDLVMQESLIDLSVPTKDLATVHENLAALPLPPFDQSRLPAAIARAFTAYNLDPSCLPECGGAIGNFITTPQITEIPAPPWTLASWQIPAHDN